VNKAAKTTLYSNKGSF